MADQKVQNYANHVRTDVMFHQVLFPIAAICVLLALWIVIRNFSLSALELLLLAIALMLAALRLRAYATKLQDRIIRVEERLRLAVLVPENLRPSISELTEGQLIALRFASDAEAPALAQRALNEKMSKDDIKKAVVNWRPDDFRV